MTRRPILLLFLLLLLPSETWSQMAEITIEYDDSKSPSRYSHVYHCGQWNPITGDFVDDWMNFDRRPMRDDGLQGDVRSGDGIWTAIVRLKVNPGQVYYWGCDTDTDPDNGWLGPNGAISVESSAPQRILARSMPDEAYETAEALGQRMGFDPGILTTPRLVGNGERVLFTYGAPTAKRVYLATQINNWANNQQGKVTDPRALMFYGSNGIYFRTLPADQDVIRYKFVVESHEGTFEWVADTRAARSDDDGNSVVLVKELRDAAAATVASPIAGEPIRWEVVGPARAADLRMANRPVLFYVRLTGNARCDAFEKRYLSDQGIWESFRGTKGYILDATSPEMRQVLQNIAVARVPTIAYCAPSGACEQFIWTESRSDDELRAFLQRIVPAAGRHPY